MDQFKQVIDVKAEQWRDHEKYFVYLRPSTLFKQENFENYLNEKLVVEKKVRRERLRPPVYDFCKGEDR